jgi:hypothetical protein
VKYLYSYNENQVLCYGDLEIIRFLHKYNIIKFPKDLMNFATSNGKLEELKQDCTSSEMNEAVEIMYLL